MKNKGFSFVELLVALAILGIVSLPIASSFVSAAKIDARAKATYSAATAADDILLLVTDIDQMTLPDGSAENKQEYFIKTLFDATPEPSDADVNAHIVYRFEYLGYHVEMTLKPCFDNNNVSFYRVDIALAYSVAGETLLVERKGVLPNA